MKNLLGILFITIITGCAEHYHTVRVTSNPSNQPVTVVGYREDNVNLEPEAGLEPNQNTPCEFTFNGKVKTVQVILRKDGSQKIITFQHGVETTEIVRQPVFGLPILAKQTYKLDSTKDVHFDK